MADGDEELTVKAIQKISVFDSVKPVSIPVYSCLPPSIGVDPFKVLGGCSWGQNEDFWMSIGWRWAVNRMSIAVYPCR